MGKPVIAALLVAVAVGGFLLGRSSDGTTARAVVTPSQTVRPTVLDRIPVLCDDTMRLALASWQQLHDKTFAKEISAYLTSQPGSSEHAAAQQDLAGESAKLWATYGKHGGHSVTVALCLKQWLHQPAPVRSRRCYVVAGPRPKRVMISARRS